MDLTIKEFKTDSGNRYWLIFERGNIMKPIAVLDLSTMENFKRDLIQQTKGIN